MDLVRAPGTPLPLAVIAFALDAWHTPGSAPGVFAALE